MFVMKKKSNIGLPLQMYFWIVVNLMQDNGDCYEILLSFCFNGFMNRGKNVPY